ncbi:MAG: hypothetical protein KBC48_00040 [Candidatus Pacebacteria bacterium]|nr:hypothetical protein [Candidatus Paceibacterota bacterium]
MRAKLQFARLETEASLYISGIKEGEATMSLQAVKHKRIRIFHGPHRIMPGVKSFIMRIKSLLEEEVIEGKKSEVKASIVPDPWHKATLYPDQLWAKGVLEIISKAEDVIILLIRDSLGQQRFRVQTKDPGKILQECYSYRESKLAELRELLGIAS